MEFVLYHELGFDCLLGFVCVFVVILFLTRFHQRVGTIILEKLFKSGVIVRILPSPLRLSGLIFLSQLAFDVFEKFLAFSFNKLLFLALLPYGYVLTCLCFPRGNTWGLFKKGRSFVLIATFNQLLSLTGFFFVLSGSFCVLSLLLLYHK